MNHGIKRRLQELKESRKIFERQDYAIISVPGKLTTIEIDVDPILEAIDKEITFLERLIGEGGETT